MAMSVTPLKQVAPYHPSVCNPPSGSSASSVFESTEQIYQQSILQTFRTTYCLVGSIVATWTPESSIRVAKTATRRRLLLKALSKPSVPIKQSCFLLVVQWTVPTRHWVAPLSCYPTIRQMSPLVLISGLGSQPMTKQISFVSITCPHAWGCVVIPIYSASPSSPWFKVLSALKWKPPITYTAEFQSLVSQLDSKFG